MTIIHLIGDVMSSAFSPNHAFLCGWLRFGAFPFDNSSSDANLKTPLGRSGPGADGLCHQDVL